MSGICPANRAICVVASSGTICTVDDWAALVASTQVIVACATAGVVELAWIDTAVPVCAATL